MRTWWLAAVLVAPLLTGCLSFLEDDEEDDGGIRPAPVDHDPEDIVVSGFVEHSITLMGFDNNTTLSTLVYEPTSPSSLPDGSAPKWPIVILLHPWGSPKEWWTDLPYPDQDRNPQPRDFMAELASEGILAVAYDARGFARSSGQSTVAGPAEMADLDAVIEQVREMFPTTDFVGVSGISYGGGQALNAWATNPRITTAAVHQGWADLHLALFPGNVPKLMWTQTLLASQGAAGQARYSPIVQDWYENMYTRADADGVEAQMDLRSAKGRMNTAKPLYVCDAMQDSLMMQYGQIDAEGFLRARVHEGGHLARDDACWDATKDWFLFFLAGRDTGVATWPALETVDALGDTPVQYKSLPAPEERALYLHNGDLADAPLDTATFTVSQRVIGNPFEYPDVARDLLGGVAPVPEQFRQDPTAVNFVRDFPNAGVIIGAPTLTLTAQDVNQTYQAVAELYLERTGTSYLLGRAAYAVLDENDHANGTVQMQFPWTKANIHPNDRLRLEVSANDPLTYMPLNQNYNAVFTGDSYLSLGFI